MSRSGFFIEVKMVSVTDIRSLIGITEFRTNDNNRYFLITSFVGQDFGFSTSNTKQFLSSILFKLDDNNAETCERALRSLVSELSVLGYLISPDLSNIQNVRHFHSKLGFSAYESLPLTPVINRASLIFDEQLPTNWRDAIRNYCLIESGKTDRFSCLSHFSEQIEQTKPMLESINVSNNGNQNDSTVLMAHENFALTNNGWMLLNRVKDFQITRIKRFGFANFTSRTSTDYFNIVQLNGLTINTNDLCDTVINSVISSNIIINGKLHFQDKGEANYIQPFFEVGEQFVSEKELNILALCSVKRSEETLNLGGNDFALMDSIFDQCL